MGGKRMGLAAHFVSELCLKNGLPHVTEGAHQRKVKALIT